MVKSRIANQKSTLYIVKISLCTQLPQKKFLFQMLAIKEIAIILTSTSGR